MPEPTTHNTDPTRMSRADRLLMTGLGAVATLAAAAGIAEAVHTDPTPLDEQRNAVVQVVKSGDIPDGYGIFTIPNGGAGEIAREMAAHSVEDSVDKFTDQVGTADGGINAGDRVLLKVSEYDNVTVDTVPVQDGEYAGVPTELTEVPVISITPEKQ